MTLIIKEIDNIISQEHSVIVPTMGSLHDGHKSLIEIAKKTNNKVIVSIFVNEKQFNDQDDFKNYPRNEQRDLEILSDLEVDYVFLPENDYIYPFNEFENITSGNLGSIYEGHFRPGHFDGVLTVVKRLFDLVNPDVAVFGKKDAQQLFLIKNMIQNYKMNIEIIEAPTVRSSSGLALSSRNNLLDDTHLEIASSINKILKSISENIKSGKEILQSLNIGIQEFENNNHIELEYLDIVTIQNFSNDIKNSSNLLLIFAGYINGVRLIDNLEILL